MAIRINSGEYVLKDDSNGEIYNDSGVLSQKGSVNYTTGDIDIEFVSADTVTEDITVDYVRNKANVTTYKNLNTGDFTFDVTSLDVTDKSYGD